MTELNHTPVDYSTEQFQEDLERLGLSRGAILDAVDAVEALVDAAAAPYGDMRVVALSTIVAYKLNQDPEDLVDEEPEYHFVAAVRATLPSPSAGLEEFGPGGQYDIGAALQEGMPDDDGGAQFLTAPEPLMSKDLYDEKMKGDER